MKIQKYRRSLHRIRLSRNSYNLHSHPIITSKPRGVPAINIDLPIGKLSWDKFYKGTELSGSIQKEYKDRFTAHQIRKYFYGDLNKFNLHKSPLHLEERLDTLIFRSGRPHSIFQSRLFIRHGLVSINGVVSRNISTLVPLGSVIQIKYPNVNLRYAPHPPHLYVKHLPDNSSFILYKKPLLLDMIRYPIGFNPKL